MSDGEMMFELPRNIERYLAALSRLYAQQGEKKKLSVIVNSSIRVAEEWSRDNWNGGTYGHALYLVLPEALFLSCVNEKDRLQSQIKVDINKVHNVQNEFVEEVFIEMEMAEDRDWRRESGMLLSGEHVVPPEAEKRIWSDEYFRVFLCHRSAVKQETANLAERLKVFGAWCFVAHANIRPTREWQDEIENALFTMDAFVALMTEGFHHSDWTDQEVGFAFARGVPIVPVRLGTDPYGFIGKFQALSCSWDAAAQAIVEILLKHDRMLDAYIRALRRCDSFDLGNTLSKILPSIERISDQQANELVAAFKANGQVRESYGFTGEKPYHYGQGLAFHLKRLTGKEYALSVGDGPE